MAKDLKDMTRQEVHSYFKFKDYRGEQLKVVMAALDYGVDVSYLRLFDDTGIPAEIMANMFTAMKEDYGVEAAAFLSTVSQPENGCIFLEALKSGVPLHELKGVWAERMLPIELREKILPLVRGREAIPEKVGEKMEFISEAVRELKESFLRQDSFLKDLRKAMEENPALFWAQEEDAEAAADPCYLELEEQFRQARQDAERLLEEREETGRKIRELEAENKNLHDQLLVQRSYAEGLKEKQAAWESGNTQEKQRLNSSPDMENRHTVKRSWKQEDGAGGGRGEKKGSILSVFHFPFVRKKPDLLAKLAGELDAGQIAEIRLGIADGLTEGQLILLADKAMDAEKIRELRMTMKILNERGQGA